MKVFGSFHRKDTVLLIGAVLACVLTYGVIGDCKTYISMKQKIKSGLASDTETWQDNIVVYEEEIVLTEEFAAILWEIEHLHETIGLEPVQFQAGPMEERQGEDLYYCLPIQIVWKGDYLQVLELLENIAGQGGWFLSSVQLQIEEETTAYIQLNLYGIDSYWKE